MYCLQKVNSEDAIIYNDFLFHADICIYRIMFHNPPHSKFLNVNDMEAKVSLKGTGSINFLTVLSNNPVFCSLKQ